MERYAEIERTTRETQVRLRLELDGRGEAQVRTGVGFLDHMLELFAHHGLFDLQVEAQGDVHVDDHHLVDDVGICLGKALREALGERKGIVRYGTAFVPMDEALVSVHVDISGRPYLDYGLSLEGKIGTFDAELLEGFFREVSQHGGLSLHVRQWAGRNRHHVAEAAFKALARALKEATRLDPRQEGVPSTKGMLE